MTSGADEIISLYERHAAAWAKSRQSHRFMEAQWMRRFRALLTPAGSVLDLGCGSGRPLAEHLIENGFAVVGVDSSTTLIGGCCANFPDQQWLVADMRNLSLGRRFEGLIAWDSFFHLSHEHQRDMFRVFREHAADGAALMFTSGTAHGVAIGSFEGERLYHASLSPSEYRELLELHGFGVIRHISDDPDCGGHTVWLAQYQARSRQSLSSSRRSSD